MAERTAVECLVEKILIVKKQTIVDLPPEIALTGVTVWGGRNPSPSPENKSGKFDQSRRAAVRAAFVFGGGRE
jgi:hypothetical protein